MSDIKKDDLLTQILKHAKKIGGDSGTISPAQFVISVIDALNGVETILISEEEKAALTKTLSTFFIDAEKDFSDLKNRMVDKLKSTARNYTVEGLYMECQMNRASISTDGTEQTVSANALLNCILSDPDPLVKLFITCDFQPSDAFSKTDTAPLVGFSAESPSAKEAERIEESYQSAEKERAKKKAAESKKAILGLTQKVKEMHKILSDKVLGQEHAVGTFVSGYFQSEIQAMTEAERHHPRATFLFAGPPGVGKTLLAKSVAKTLDLPFKPFDMSEYSDKEAAMEFIGSDAVWRDSKRGIFTEFIAENPRSVILLDEIEKAHISIILLFLQILDEGRIRDKHTDETHSLTDTILIFTTNAGKQLYENSESGDLSGISRNVVLQALRNDVDPQTKEPFFPAAICSRFATGNVVMFNHVAACTLYTVAKREILRNARSFENTFGVEVTIDELVYSALLFSEGMVDARTINGRAGAFFENEIFELFRLLNSDKASDKSQNLESVSIGIELPEDNKEILSLFVNPDNKGKALVVASDAVYQKCTKRCKDVELVYAATADDTDRLIHAVEFDFVLIDIAFDRIKNSKYLNVEDIESTARDIFWFIREHYPDMPIYLLQTEGKELNNEERMSFLRQGAKGFIRLSGTRTTFSKDVKSICDINYQQRSFEKLARANKQITFETAQIVESDGKRAQIKLFDLELIKAVHAEDVGKVVDNISKPDVTFAQVIGAKDAIHELDYFVQYLRNPKKFLGTGVSAPKGVILYGPPGTGKTMLAKATANASDVTFISAEGNQFLQGNGIEKVHEIFRTARKYAPSILFIDEIDAIAKARTGMDPAREAILTAFLTEMDGFKKDTTKPVFVLAATNFDVDPGNPKSLDAALMRRFDRRLFIDLPTRDERAEYIRMMIKKRQAFAISDEKVDNIATRTVGMSLADIESVMELSLRIAIRSKDEENKVTDAILDDALETFRFGDSEETDPEMIRHIAVHEAGHAVISWLGGDAPSYITVVARGDHGGYMGHGAEAEKKMLRTKKEMLARIRASLGGRAAELVYYGPEGGLTSGASGDLDTATRWAKWIVCYLGMDEGVGLAVIDPREADGEMSAKIWGAVNKILEEEMKNAIRLIGANRKAVDALVDRLLRDNHLTGDEIQTIFEETIRKPE